MIKKGLFKRELIANATYYGVENLKFDFNILVGFNPPINIKVKDYTILLRFSNKSTFLKVHKEISELIETGFEIGLPRDVIFSTVIIKYIDYDLSCICQELKSNLLKISFFQNH